MKTSTARVLVRFFLWTAAAFGCGPVFAQAPSDGKPLVLTIRPSGYDKVEDPKARQEKLLKRMEQKDYWVRSICVQCGDSWKHQIYAPFNPLDTLGQKGGGEASPE